jgi:hypothetical protein
MTWPRLLEERPERLTISQVFELSLRTTTVGWHVPDQVNASDGLRYVRQGERFDRSDLLR